VRALRGQSWAIARKELRTHFGSPLALIFLGVFLAVTLFVFFWVETFFARNLADLRPLFQWMPVLMIFLVATLTMRQWSEEERGGTLEVLLTLPVHRLHLALGKFIAVMALIVVALALTFTLPVTVSVLGDVDWGPVFGGYLAAVLMASVYTSIGLFFSSRTDNQIVSLILTVLLGGALYLVGTSGVTAFAGDAYAEAMRAIGTGSRFESIGRGVFDLRDLVYYMSLTTFFFSLTVLSLDVKRWSRGANTAAYRRNAAIGVVLVGANLLALNFWLSPLSGLRADLTEQNEYSLSGTTRDLISNLQEPLLLRGYFGERTHPLLAPLVPAIRDLMHEYEVASDGMVTVEILDPRDDEEIEEEANRAYGIRATPFTVSERHESAVVNSYFDILVRYGDQFITLGFAELIEFEQRPGSQPEVRLRSLEYDLTSSIKRVVSGFRSLEAVFASLDEPMKLTAFVTPGTLPELVQDVPQRFEDVAGEFVDRSGGNLVFETLDPDAPGGAITRETLTQTYGISPYQVSLFSPDTYYLHLMLEYAGANYLVVPTGEMAETDIREVIQAALKRAVPGFLKNVAVWLPPSDPVLDPFSNTEVPPISSWRMAAQQLGQSYTTQPADLETGQVSGNVDVLVLIAPQGITDVEQFAVDQFLMRGGAVVVAGGNFIIAPIQLTPGLTIEPVQGGLQNILAGYGVEIGQTLVMDSQNEPFPMQIARDVGGISIVEIQRVSYPFFVDVRRDGMEKESPITASLPSVTLRWASPLNIDLAKNQDREVTTLLRSSDKSWISESLQVMPDLDAYPDTGFAVEGEQRSWPLAVSIQGSFKSFFSDRPSPFEGEEPGLHPPVIEESPDSSRLVVIGSSEFLDDLLLNLSRSLAADRFLLDLQFLQNAVDWAAEDVDLLSLRSGGIYTRLLDPLDESDVDLLVVELDKQTFWEVVNYGVALAMLVLIGVVSFLRRRAEAPMTLVDDGGES
jgi:ABC-2 type transport system permease protein